MTTRARAKHFIVTGDPGVGKTTLTKKLVTLINEIGIRTVGFYSEEVKKDDVREGFDVVTLDGKRGRLARDLKLLGAPTKYRVGKYGVLLSEFEKIALPALAKVNDRLLCIVIDEIGKMEFYSEPFKARIKEILNSNFACLVLATVPVRNSDPLIEFIRNQTRAKVWKITTENRDTIHEDIMVEIKASVNNIPCAVHNPIVKKQENGDMSKK